MHSPSAEDGAIEPRSTSDVVDRRLTTVAAVVTILGARDDLRGVNGLADHLDYALRWSV